MANSIPQLLEELRPTLAKVAGWVNSPRPSVEAWRWGRYQPQTDKRAILIKAVRKHAAELLRLAQAVEDEGETRTVDARSRPQRRASGRGRVPAPLRRGAAGRSAARTRRGDRRGGAE